MDIKIEYGRWDDLDNIEKLYHDAIDALEVNGNYPKWKKDVYPCREDAAMAINNQTLFVVRNEKNLIGSIILNHIPENGYKSAPWQIDVEDDLALVIHTLVVHPSFSNVGIGTKLMKFAEVYGKQHLIKAIRLDVYEQNQPAILLYERCEYNYISTVDLGLSEYGLKWFKLYEKLL